MTRNRIITLLLAALLLCGSLCFSGCNFDKNTLDGITYELTADKTAYRAVSYSGNTESLTIPSIFKGLPVTEIGNSAFYGNSRLKELTISEGITSIGLSAFRSCRSLETVSLPASTVDLKGYVFSDCISMTSFTVATGNSAFSSIDGVLFNADATELLHYPASRSAEPQTTDGTEPQTTDGTEPQTVYVYTFPESVTKIAAEAFRNCNYVNKLVLPAGLTEIGDYAFFGFTGLTEISFKNITSIGDYAFSGCSSLKRAVIPDSVTGLGVRAFSGCTSLERLVVGLGVDVIEDSAFSSCVALKSALLVDTALPDNSESDDTVPEGVQTICSNAFYGCSNMSQIYLPRSLKMIESKAFTGCTGLKFVCYSGTSSEYNEIEKENNNTCLDDALLYMDYNDNSIDRYRELTK